MADVITKFTYLEHGKKAPGNSNFKGVVTTESIIGFKKYGERKTAKVLSKEAQEIQDGGFFDYTNSRIGATQTYSSIGWIKDAKSNKEIRKEIASHFDKDGDFIWVPVISLRDYLTSTEMKLFNEKDYAAIFDKILPSWFDKVGFENSNMIWWIDHHVNTDNPHIHLSFLEKKKTMNTGKLPMKHINDFKSKFWNEVFSKARYLEATGIAAAEGFKNKDLLKKETLSSFKEEMKVCQDEEFLDRLKSLYSKLPSDGRLQYNSSHMIPFRKDLDLIVDKLLSTPSVKEKYLPFVQALKEFDLTKTKSLTTEYNSIYRQEDRKLRTQLANCILKEYKKIDKDFWGNANIAIDKEHLSDSILIPVAKSLIKEITNDYTMFRVPKTSKYIKVENENKIFLSAHGNMNVFKLEKIEAYDLYDRNGFPLNDKIEVSDMNLYFTNGDEYMNKIQNASTIRNNMREWAYHSNDWVANSRHLQKASFSWMNKIQNEVEQGQEEFLRGKELSI